MVEEGLEVILSHLKTVVVCSKISDSPWYGGTWYNPLSAFTELAPQSRSCGDTWLALGAVGLVCGCVCV